uniref:Dolichyl-diphosphooligosaccharide--protein glycosyltransferase subunit 1 n=1 Tax=Albugo laibachii Nc14 TaxID=890382 RepID=F0WYB7_9STRA|nr:dolichyldiphosphooligosaccharideprotein glycosyltransferase subunit putative [Albugo laibachii Nc14]|eukprot:CCA26469.1 dolichyldiphosphooligosaccharideprotein glycosyltransferase subunit putative [Albugo laibachii Nc14]
MRLQFLRAFLLTLGLHRATQAAIINKSIKRVIDLTQHIVRVSTEISITDPENEINEYVIAIHKSINEHVAYISASKFGEIVSSDDIISKKESSVATHILKLKKPIATGEVGTIKITMQLTRSLIPYPAQIKQQDDQKVLYYDSQYVLSPYATKEQTTKLKMPSPRVESFSKLEPYQQKGSFITYGPYENVESFSGTPKDVRIHYRNHSPFITVTELTKEIELSMWGRVSVEEVYDLSHTGAVLKGSFSRLKYAQGATGASFSELRATLPKEAIGLYYRDQIGNITTSRVRVTSKSTEVELTPRFPMMGGWKTQFYFGYALPTWSVLKHAGDSYKLEVEFSSSIAGIAVDSQTLKIILPEGARDAKVDVPFHVDKQSETRRLTYLDTSLIGRPVLILKKKNLTGKHNAIFTVTFDFPSKFMLLEPGLLISAFFVFFVFCMIILRCDLSIAQKSRKKKAD